MTSKRAENKNYGNNVFVIPIILFLLLIFINIGSLLALKASFVTLLLINALYFLSVSFVFRFFNSKFLNFVIFILVWALDYVIASKLI